MMMPQAGHEGAVPAKSRDGGIDILKGILVIGMIWTHALQFFANPSSVTASWIETYGNVTSYAGFVFCFGYANQLSYFNRSFGHSWKRMLRTAFKILVAFYLSGSFFRVFVSQEPASWSTVSQILVLNDIPGWSEFLAGFFALTVFAVCFFRPLVWLVEKKRWFWFVFCALLATTFFPYGVVGPNQLGLFVGSTHFASFSVLQYLPYYLVGMYLARHRIFFQYRLMAGAAAGTLLFVVYVLANGGQLPTRFPPSLFWITSSMLLVYSYFLVSRKLMAYRLSLRVLSAMGRNVLVYLLVGNICLFTLKSAAAAYLTLNPWQSLVLAAVLMGIAAYLVELVALNKRGSYAPVVPAPATVQDADGAKRGAAG